MLSISVGSEDRVKGISLLFYQYGALLIKRCQYSLHRPKAFFVQNILPLVVIIISLAIAHILLDINNPPPLLLQPSMFFGISPYNYAIIGNNKTGASRNYVDTVFQQCGLGAKLLGNPNDPQSPCYRHQSVPDCNNYEKLNYRYNTPVCVDGCGNCSDRVSINDRPPSCYNGTVVSL